LNNAGGVLDTSGGTAAAFGGQTVYVGTITGGANNVLAKLFFRLQDSAALITTANFPWCFRQQQL
jgi:hypothetical protein